MSFQVICRKDIWLFPVFGCTNFAFALSFFRKCLAGSCCLFCSFCSRCHINAIFACPDLYVDYWGYTWRTKEDGHDNMALCIKGIFPKARFFSFPVKYSYLWSDEKQDVPFFLAPRGACYSNSSTAIFFLTEIGSTLSHACPRLLTVSLRINTRTIRTI